MPTARHSIACFLVLLSFARESKAEPRPFGPQNGGPLTVANFASGTLQETVGNRISIDQAVKIIGVGSAHRAASAAYTSFLSTGFGVQHAAGWTIQYWFRPAAPTVFGYHWGDPLAVSPLGGTGGGAWRVYQNGTGAGPGGLVLRGVPNQLATLGSSLPDPLISAVNGQGWVHLAWRFDPATALIELFVNGNVTAAAAQTAGLFNWSGVDLIILGFSNTTALAGEGHYDDYRVYGFARTTADVSGDYLTGALGVGPSGTPNLPDVAYFPFDQEAAAHEPLVGVNTDPVGALPRLVTSGTPIRLGATSANQAGNPATCFINITAGLGLGNHFSTPAESPGCATPGIPFLDACHAFSQPAGSALLLPDGLGLGALGVGTPWGIPYVYGGATPTLLSFTLPPGLLTGGGVNANGTPLTGQEISLQWIAVDPGWPASVGTSARTSFRWVDPVGGGPNGEGFHFEVRSYALLQTPPPWQVWNTGSVDITRAELDCGGHLLSAGVPGAGPAVAGAGFNTVPFCTLCPALAVGQGYGNGSDLACDLANLGGVPTYTNGPGGPPPGGTAEMLTFDFAPGGAFAAGRPGATGMENGFTATIDRLAFLCDSSDPWNGSGARFIGMTVSVTFANGTRMTGTTVADPTDPHAAILNM